MSNDLFWPPTEAGSGDRAGGTEPPVPPGRPDRPGRPWRASAVAAGLAALVFGGIGVGVGAEIAGGNSSPTTNNAGLTVAPVSGNVASDPKSLAGVAAKVLPAVVSINVQVSGGGDTGSGVILRQDGYILTNNHVVAAAVDGGGTVTVTFNDGTTAAATIVGADAE